jgi:hypothetical protein
MPRTASMALALLMLAAGCDGASAPPDTTLDGGVDGGPSCTVLDWDPDSGELTRWPEPSLLVADDSTETGVRLRFDEAAFPGTSRALAGYLPVFTEDLAELDGFGVNAEVFFVFGRAFDVATLPSGERTTEPDAGLGLLILDAAKAALHPVLTETTDEGRTLLLAPMGPLPARSTVAAFVTRRLTEAAGGCLEPSPSMRAALESPDAATSAAIEALLRVGAIASAEELVALTVFPTQSIEDDSVAVAEDVASRGPPTLVGAPTCVRDTRFVRCDAVFRANDYRDEDGVFRREAGAPAAPVASYDVPFSVWLPLEGTPPYPMLFYGHGLSSGHEQAARLAELAAPEGYATVASPALMHGLHPTNPDPDASALSVVLQFFAIGDLGERALHAGRLRDHFRQTTWDRLQLTQWLQGGPDVDGDGAPDLDGGRLAYLGVSLGGIMGPELLATTDAYGAGVLVVPGGRVSTIISDSRLFGTLVEALRPRRSTEGDVRRFFPVLQTVLDRGDAASFGAHTLRDRFERAPRTPSVLVGVVLDDEVVPNVANYALGRALALPIVEPLLRPEPGFAVVAGPLSGNVAGGSATAGLLQFDIIGDGVGGTRAAEHDNIGDSEVGAEAWLDFLRSHFELGLARVRDPYEAVGLPRP